MSFDGFIVAQPQTNLDIPTVTVPHVLFTNIMNILEDTKSTSLWEGGIWEPGLMNEKATFRTTIDNLENQQRTSMWTPGLWEPGLMNEFSSMREILRRTQQQW